MGRRLVGIDTAKGFGIFLKAIDDSVLIPKMAWSVFQLAVFLLLVFFMWEIILRLWGKLYYSFSVEWEINLVAVIPQLKKPPYLYTKEQLYDPVKVKEKEEVRLIIRSMG